MGPTSPVRALRGRRAPAAEHRVLATCQAREVCPALLVPQALAECPVLTVFPALAVFQALVALAQ